MKTWGNHCLCEWCCPNRIENMFCICARNLDDVIETCDHDTRIIIAKRNSDVIKELERRMNSKIFVISIRRMITLLNEEKHG